MSETKRLLGLDERARFSRAAAEAVFYAMPDLVDLSPERFKAEVAEIIAQNIPPFALPVPIVWPDKQTDSLRLALRRAMEHLDCWRFRPNGKGWNCPDGQLCPACLVHADAQAVLDAAESR